MQSRIILCVLDSFGLGYSRDAQLFGDKGANTLLHIAEKHHSPLKLPHLCKLGLAKAAQLVCQQTIPGLDNEIIPIGLYGYAQPLSTGKDTQSGHWEIAGVPVLTAWGYFPDETPCFPTKLTDELIIQGKLPGILGNCHASGTNIIEQLGEEHIKTGKPIVYTSADSVFQIAAHEKYFGLEKLYALCKIARRLVDEYNIGRVIARPFIGEVGHFARTANRHDYAIPPPDKTLLDNVIAARGQVIAIGKIADIFVQQGVSQSIRAPNDDALFTETVNALKTARDKTFIFTNFVDFDTLYGHRRNVAGYANALEAFDRRLPELFQLMNENDMLVITADHGCDPTWPGSDHTREVIPVLVYNRKIASHSIGERGCFADIGQSIADYWGLPPLKYGKSFIKRRI